MRTIQVEGGEVFPRTPLNSTTAQCVGICATRHKFETVLRQQVLAKCPGIELTSGGTVKGLLLSNDRTAVTGEAPLPVIKASPAAARTYALHAGKGVQD